MNDENRWFDPEELTEMARPTLDRVIEAIEAGEPERALELCREMKHEWRFLHDLMVESTVGLVDFVKRRLGEEHVEGAVWPRRRRNRWLNAPPS